MKGSESEAVCCPSKFADSQIWAKIQRDDLQDILTAILFITSVGAFGFAITFEGRRDTLAITTLELI